ncbi:hypothetical protein N9O57_00985 [bacterium]|nr:hypothetical protein [bacterium]
MTCVNIFALTKEDIEILKLEGAYKIDSSSNEKNQQIIKNLDRLVIFRNTNYNAFTVSLASAKFNMPIYVFRNAYFTLENENLKITGEGSISHKTYGHISLTINTKSMRVTGFYTDSNMLGPLKIKGKSLYSLEKCLSINTNKVYSFPSCKDLTGQYKAKNGNLLLLKSYPSGALSLSIKKPLKTGGFANMNFQPGIYNDSIGLLDFPWSSMKLFGKVYISYYPKTFARKSYLKVFSISAGGGYSATSYYPQNR